MTAPRPDTSRLTEMHLLGQVADEYRQRGYDVVLEPRAQDLPASLRELHPDLLASRDDDRVAVIVKRSRRAFALRTVPDMDTLRAEGWRVELFFADDPAPPIAPPDAVTELLREAEQLVDSQHKVAALLLIWAPVEEVLRGLASRFAPGETGRKVLLPDQAYSMGLISENQHRLLSNLRYLRNQAAHNITQVSVPDSAIRDTVELLERMNRPTYVPPPIMADRVYADFDPSQETLEQVKRLFPHADPAEQADAAEYVRSLQLSNKA
jgi:REase_AHJR-like